MTGVGTAVSVACFLLWLCEVRLPEADAIYWLFLRWFSFVVERSRWSEGISTDPFTAPALLGGSKKKSRRISEILKDAVSASAAEGKVGRSAR